jgi:hypothetical protein
VEDSSFAGWTNVDDPTGRKLPGGPRKGYIGGVWRTLTAYVGEPIAALEQGK